MSELPSSTPVPPKKGRRGLIIFGVVVAALVGYEFLAHQLANVAGDQAAAITAGVQGGISFDPGAVEAARSAAYGSMLLQAHIWLLCPLMVVLAIWGIRGTTRRRMPVPPAANPTVKTDPPVTEPKPDAS